MNLSRWHILMISCVILLLFTKKTFKDAQSVYEYVEKHYDTLPDVIIPYETLTDFKNAIDHGIFDWYFEMYITADDYKVWDAAIREGKASI